ncbi:retrotransposon protein, putative, ty1-copia subclass [Tanacetum coccineum]
MFGKVGSPRYGYYVDIEEYELEDLNEPPNYKAALADPESDKWLEAMNTECNPSCLVAKGFTQTYGVDYGETFSPVANSRAIRILLAIAAFDDYEIWQMDVKTAFLNGHLSEDNKRFDEEIKKICFTQNPNEPCVYLKASGSNVAFLVLYVDDILLMGNSVTMLQEVKSWLYNILKKFRMKNSKKGYTLIMEKPDYRKFPGAKTPTEVQRMQRVPYALVQNPGEIHWTAVKNILKYLRNTKDMVLLYRVKPEDELKISCYADANFQTDNDDIKPQTGYVFILIGGAVDWKNAKQSNTAMSSTEAEYIVVDEASMEAVWMTKFIDGLGDVMPSNKRPMEMICDNEPALAIASDPEGLKGARHFKRKYHYIREVIQEGEIVLKKVHTDDNVADPFTKQCHSISILNMLWQLELFLLVVSFKSMMY